MGQTARAGPYSPTNESCPITVINRCFIATRIQFSPPILHSFQHPNKAPSMPVKGVGYRGWAVNVYFRITLNRAYTASLTHSLNCQSIAMPLLTIYNRVIMFRYMYLYGLRSTVYNIVFIDDAVLSTPNVNLSMVNFVQSSIIHYSAYMYALTHSEQWISQKQCMRLIVPTEPLMRGRWIDLGL
jgi:hypothetical protein